MRQFLSVVGPLVGNFVVWTVVSYLPVHPMVVFILVIMSGVAMVSVMSYLVNKIPEDSPIRVTLNVESSIKQNE